jgi:hypothetical protein
MNDADATFSKVSGVTAGQSHIFSNYLDHNAGFAALTMNKEISGGDQTAGAGILFWAAACSRWSNA